MLSTYNRSIKSNIRIYLTIEIEVEVESCLLLKDADNKIGNSFWNQLSKVGTEAEVKPGTKQRKLYISGHLK